MTSTNPEPTVQITQADQETAMNFRGKMCPAPEAHGFGGAKANEVEATDCNECVALELAKVRQQAHAEMQAAAISWAVEWTLKQTWKREDCPQSWDAGFPSYKASALLQNPTLDGTNALEEYIKAVPLKEIAKIRGVKGLFVFGGTYTRPEFHAEEE